jgi:hypothetical protein
MSQHAGRLHRWVVLTRILLLGALPCLLDAPAGRAATGGPDGFGYTWRDGAEPGVFYAWEDISLTGRDITPLIAGDDQSSGFQPLSFAVPYYGGAYTQLAVCSNGWVSLVDGTSTTYTNVVLPAGGVPTGLVAAHWDDLTLGGSGQVRMQDFGDRVVVSWLNVPYLRGGTPSTFQVILHGDGRIVVQYESIGDNTSAGLGIESPDQLNGLTVWNDDPLMPTRGYVVELAPPVPWPNSLDCTRATPLACGSRVSGDNRAGVADQDGYLCSLADYAGREQVYVMDFAVPTSARFFLTATSGNPDLIVLAGCDANLCLAAPGDTPTITNVTGTVYVVVDSAPGQEGPYTLRVDCNPQPPDLDCAGATRIDCGSVVTGDLTAGTANQGSYWCSTTDYGGREQVYVMDFTVPTDIRLGLETFSGSPDAVVLRGCDQTACAAPPGDTISLNGLVGLYHVVVDCPPGEEGQYRLRVDCDPMAPQFDCGSATPLSCGDVVTSDLALGSADQPSYWCTPQEYFGREQVYLVDFPVPTDARLILEASSGAPDLIVLRGCDPSSCAAPPGDVVNLTGAVGLYYVVVDCPDGMEGQYRLRFECYPLPVDLDCASATPLDCGDVINGDTRLGMARQDSYWCSTRELRGREQVYVLDLTSPLDLQVRLTASSGNPDLILLDGCDPNLCLAGPADTVGLADAFGLYYLVVDSEAGQEGAYQLEVLCLADSFNFCGGGLVQTDPWDLANGSWLAGEPIDYFGNLRAAGWFYHPGDTHVYALRIDGATTYTHDNSCTQFPSIVVGAVPGGPGYVTWGAPEGQVDVTLSETSSGGCCGLLVSTTITNTDSVPHSYDWRVYHDTAFGDGDGTGACGDAGVVDGGPIIVRGVRHEEEVELLPLGADTCEGQVMMESTEEPGRTYASYQMLPPTPPTDMEYVAWNNGGAPCATWTDFVDGDIIGDCDDDTSLLLIWRVPATGGTLAPGERATINYRIGYFCAWPCSIACEDPVLTTGDAVDLGPCHDGIEVTWIAAAFPGPGRGVYHVYRSTTSFADAMTRPAITPPAGVPGTVYVDATTIPNQTHYYVVQAESLDFPDCGTGPVVRGSTDEIQVGPVLDDSDVDPPTATVGDALRATGHGTDTVDFDWSLAPLPGPGEQHVVLRSDDQPAGPLAPIALVPAQVFTDPSAPPRYSPNHCWYYKVAVADECGNFRLE